MLNTTFQFDFNDLNIRASQIDAFMGYKDEAEKEIFTAIIEEILIESEDLNNIRAEYRIWSGVDFNDLDKSINLNHLNFQLKKVVFGQIKKSDSIAVFLSTAGSEIGIRSKKAIQDGDMLKGFIYDIVGNIVVETAADLMQAELEKWVLGEKKKITNRYNPGYCWWNVAEQHKLFQLVPDNFCGIRLTQSALMDPVKSSSGIIGIGIDVKYNPYTCNYCDQKDCGYRRIREKP